MNSEPGKGIYNLDYFSGAQVALYIGSIWVDEVTSITYEKTQRRVPLYGYADRLYRGLAEGQVIVNGSFTVNFKEAGYLWLILNKYKEFMSGKSILEPFQGSAVAKRDNISQIINGEMNAYQRNQTLQNLVKSWGDQQFKGSKTLTEQKVKQTNSATQASLGGFASNRRLGGGTTAEDLFERFEDRVWQVSSNAELNNDARSADDPRLNPFDIYIAYGDYMGDNTVNHTIRKIVDVSIIGTAQQVVIDGMPIQEQYQFVARNIV